MTSALPEPRIRPEGPDLSALEPLRRLTVDDYHRMIDAGILDEDDRVELVEGVLIEVSPQSPLHALIVERLSDPLFIRLGRDFVVRCQLPLSLGRDSEPEPDVAILARTEPRATDTHPGSARLVFEVARDSTRRDRVVKGRLYARAGIPEYVLVDVNARSLEVYRDPDPGAGAYRSATTLGADDTFASLAVPGVTFAVSRLLAVE